MYLATYISIGLLVVLVNLWHGQNMSFWDVVWVVLLAPPIIMGIMVYCIVNRVGWTEGCERIMKWAETIGRDKR